MLHRQCRQLRISNEIARHVITRHQDVQYRGGALAGWRHPDRVSLEPRAHEAKRLASAQGISCNPRMRHDAQESAYRLPWQSDALVTIEDFLKPFGGGGVLSAPSTHGVQQQVRIQKH